MTCARLQTAFDALIARHDSLRTAFVLRGGELRQEVTDDISLCIKRRECDHSELNSRLKSLIKPFDMAKALTEIPDYVVFNGSVGAMTGDDSIRANVGETVRLFVGNGGPNLVSSFHVIGEIFDNVYVEGGDMINHNVQSTMVPAGGSAIVEFKVEVPGTLILVDHSIFRAFNKGALAMLKIDGPENLAIYSGKEEDTVYLPEGGGIQSIAASGAVEVATAKNKAERILFGKRTYDQNCLACLHLISDG